MKRRDFKTLGTLVSEMRAIVVRDDTRIQYRTLKSCEARLTYPADGVGIIIYIGRGKCGRLRAVIHELAHCILEPNMKGLGITIEEPMVAALENAVIERIFRSDNQVRWWLDQIHAKLPDVQKESG